MSTSTSEDDVPQLSSETFAALQEFYREQEEKDKMLNFSQTININSNFEMNENWQLSQFWYDDCTTTTLANIAVKSVGKHGKIALISCPSLFNKIRQINENCEVTLFEYDRRFSVHGGNFIPYDYRSPLDVPRNKSSYYDLVIADPPFLSEECLAKTAITIKFLSKGCIILCTGSVMADLAKKLLDVVKISFEPKHKNNLANEFWCFSNFNIDE